MRRFLVEDEQLNDIAGWVAPIATMIAAMMTAVNLGARVTGWGFVVFTIGSVCWATVGLSSGQTNLLATNVFLTLVNAVGIWRWLGRQRAYEDGGKSAQKASVRSSGPTLVAASGVVGMPVEHTDGAVIGKVVEALIECRTGAINYVVVATGGVGGVAEELRPVPLADIIFSCDRLAVRIDQAAFEALPCLEGDAWPANIGSGRAHAA